MLRTFTTLAALSASLHATTSSAAPTNDYKPVADYTGSNFFNDAGGWTFFDSSTTKDPTAGHALYQTADAAASQGLAGYTFNSSSKTTAAYLGVDSTSLAPAGRNSVRITSNATFSNGALIVADVLHMPLGTACAVWPALWLVGNEWPAQGEIDIIEGVNEDQYNSITLHTAPGCSTNNASAEFLGTLVGTDCDALLKGNTGCGVQAPKIAELDYGRGETCEHATAGKGFNAQGGAVYATLWTGSGISIYMFPHDYVPSDLKAGKPDPASWTVKPIAQFGGSGCDFTTSFTNLSLVINTELCGDWVNGVWPTSDCAKKHGGSCEACVSSNPAAFKDAYWSFGSIKVFQSAGSSNHIPQPLSKREESETQFQEIEVGSETAETGDSTSHHHRHGRLNHAHMHRLNRTSDSHRAV